ncbi:Hsp70 family protein [Phyllobacterium sp. CCNWLW109]|uniref:Hsp70 family protein n=1 Tax=Phyllobacterium sp. CCNWLW109 TaxID=3127479 RepID=UPI003077DB65
MPTISGSQLPPPSSWEEFQLLCTDLMSFVWKDDNVQAYGRHGQSQRGVDILGQSLNKIVGAQCKGKRRWPPKRLTVSDVALEVAKAKRFQPPLGCYTILTTDDNDTAIQDFVTELNRQHTQDGLFEVRVWGWDEIRRRLEDNSGLIFKHYGFVDNARILHDLQALPEKIRQLIDAVRLPLSNTERHGPDISEETITEELALAPDRKIVGIDFGTTGSRVACLMAGRPIILEDAHGRGTMPSNVAFSPDGRVVVGEGGQRIAVREQGSVVFATKRLIGRAYSDPVIQHLKDSLAFKIVRSEAGDAWIEVHGKAHSPIDICAAIFKKLRETARRNLCFDVRKGLVAIPAYYNETQRAAIRTAAKIGGWEVMRMIAEPTAAAVFHGDTVKDQKLVIYDFGGGTFDVSIVDYSDEVFEVLSTDGDTFLGGEDIDLRIQAYVLEALKLSSQGLSGATLRNLKDSCELAKIELCGQHVAEIAIPPEMVALGAPTSFTMNRGLLEEICEDIVQRTLDLCDRALAHAGRDGPGGSWSRLPLQDVGNVFLVGGSTHLPFIERRVEEFFARKPISGPRREDAVALGCALHGGLLSGELRRGLLLDTIPFSIGIAMSDGRIHKLFDRHLTLPYRVTRRFALTQHNSAKTSLHFFQGEGEYARDCNLLCVIDLDLVSETLTGTAVLEITADLDVDGALKVTAVNTLSGRSVPGRTERDPMTEGNADYKSCLAFALSKENKSAVDEADGWIRQFARAPNKSRN